MGFNMLFIDNEKIANELPSDYKELLLASRDIDTAEKFKEFTEKEKEIFEKNEFTFKPTGLPSWMPDTRAKAVINKEHVELYDVVLKEGRITKGWEKRLCDPAAGKNNHNNNK